jgi:phosphoribosylformylglycinamidine synthase
LTDDHGVNLFEEAYGSIVLEVTADFVQTLNTDARLFVKLGQTIPENIFEIGALGIDGSKALSVWEAPLETVFPTQHHDHGKAMTFSYNTHTIIKPKIQIAKPKVFIPVFPGTNCEYDTKRAFEKAGANVETIVFRNLTANDVKQSIEAFVKMIETSQMIALPGGFSAGDEPEGSGKFIASVFRNPQIAEAVMKLLTQRDGLMLGICNGFQALVKLELLPYGDIRDLDPLAPTLTFNKIGRHVARMADVRVSSVNSPWLSDASVGDVFKTAFSHGEGRFFASDDVIETMAKNGQIATQYVGADGHATLDGKWNINGSVHAIEGVLSPDGRVFGKMGHVERVGKNLYKNIYGENDFDIFKSGVAYFK